MNVFSFFRSGRVSRSSWLASALFASATLSAAEVAAPPADARVAEFYTIGKIATPPGVDPQLGGLALMPDGRMVAAFHHGEIALYDFKKATWKIFAEGLHEPLGVLPGKDGSILVMQRPELTRLRDTNGDGVADRYDAVFDDFGMTGNYHEFAFGPVRGPNGKLYVSLNLASAGDTIRPEIRGEWSPIGLPREKFYDVADWKKNSTEAGRMYGRVKWRGCIVEIDETTGAASLFATGFRSPDGMAFDAAGNFFVDDNQGDWRGTSPVHVVTRGGFYGHPASLVWRKDWDGAEPLKLPIEKLNSLRTVAAINLPHGIYANSPTQMAWIPKTAAWGAFGGQMVVGEMNSGRVLRLLPEQVDGVWQGACVIFVDSTALRGGIHRLLFVGDTLYLGRTHLIWAGSEGIGTVKLAKMPFEALNLHATPKGFRFEFTAPLDAGVTDVTRWAGQRYYYKYHEPYGSPQMDLTPVSPSKVTLSADNRSVDVEFAELKPGYIYDFDLGGLTSSTGETVLNPRIAYTLNRVPAK
jgi:glucose/arabinose dehydrogenase